MAKFKVLVYKRDDLSFASQVNLLCFYVMKHFMTLIMSHNHTNLYVVNS